MTDMLTLAVSERVDRLTIRVGEPPILQIGDESHKVEGPVITRDEAFSLLRSLADTRQLNNLRRNGEAKFIHVFNEATSFVVLAKLVNDTTSLDLERIP